MGFGSSGVGLRGSRLGDNPDEDESWESSWDKLGWNREMSRGFERGWDEG